MTISHKVPVIVEVYTDNTNRTTPEIRILFRNGQLGSSGSNKFLFDHVGIVEAYTEKNPVDIEEAAIEAGANEVEGLNHGQNDDIPADKTGARVKQSARSRVGARSKSGSKAGSRGRTRPRRRG